MKKFSWIFTLFIIIFMRDKTNSQVMIEDFVPGHFLAEISFYTPWLFGIDSETEQESMLPEAYNGTRTSYEFMIFPVNFDPSVIFNIQSSADKIINEAAEDFIDHQISAPKLTFTGGQKNGVTGLNLTSNTWLFLFGVGYRQLYYFYANTVWTGTSMLVSVPGVTEEAKIRIEPLVKLSSSININRFNLRFGFMLADQLAGDVVFHYYDGFADIFSITDANAIATYAGEVRSFNTDEHNSLAQSIDGSCKAGAIGNRVEMVMCNPGKNFLIKGAYERSETLKFVGDINLTTHTLPETIDPLDITATIKNVRTVSNPLNISIPESISGELVLFYNRWKLGLGYKKYLTDLTITSEIIGNYHMTMYDAYSADFIFPDGMMRFGITTTNSGIFPSFGVAITAELGNNWKLEQTLVALPLQFLKTRLSYSF